LTESSSVAIPIWRALMKENYSNREEPLPCGILLDGADISDGSCRRKISGCGNLQKDYPWPSIPLHKSQIGDFTLNVFLEGVRRYDDDTSRQMVFKYFGLELEKPNISGRDVSQESAGLAHMYNCVISPDC